MRPRRQQSALPAFTLIELLLSLAIFAVVLSAVNGVFYGAMQLRNRTTSVIEGALPAEHALSVLRRDLSGVVAPNGTLSGSLRTGVSTMSVSQEAGFEFYSNSAPLDDLYPWGEIQKISYTLRSPTNGLGRYGKTLVRLSSRNLLPTQQDIPEERWMLEGVTALAFSFYNGTQWQETWDSTTEQTILPRAVRCQITVAPEPGVATSPRALQPPLQLVVPIRVWANTNATQTTGGQQ